MVVVQRAELLGETVGIVVDVHGDGKNQLWALLVIDAEVLGEVRC